MDRIRVSSKYQGQKRVMTLSELCEALDTHVDVTARPDGRWSATLWVHLWGVRFYGYDGSDLLDHVSGVGDTSDEALKDLVGKLRDHGRKSDPTVWSGALWYVKTLDLATVTVVP